MGCSKGIIDINITQCRQLLRKAFIPLVFGAVETQVFQQQDLTRLQRLGLSKGIIAHTIRCKLNGTTNGCFECACNMSQRELILRSTLRPSKVRHEDHASTCIQDALNGRSGAKDARIITHFEGIIQWNIEINTDQGTFTGKIERIYLRHGTSLGSKINFKPKKKDG